MPKRRRILLVEDNLPYAQMLTIMLGAEEALEVVGHATTGAEGVALARRLRPDAVLMDLHLPELDGFEATRRIRGALPGTRVVMLTSSSDPEDERRAAAAGAND